MPTAVNSSVEVVFKNEVYSLLPSGREGTLVAFAFKAT